MNHIDLITNLCQKFEHDIPLEFIVLKLNVTYNVHRERKINRQKSGDVITGLHKSNYVLLIIIQSFFFTLKTNLLHYWFEPIMIFTSEYDK